MNTSKQLDKQPDGRQFKLSPDEYRQVLVGLKLRSIELINFAMVKDMDAQVAGRTIKADIKEQADLIDQGPEIVRIRHACNLSGCIDDNLEVLHIDAVYMLSFSSEVAITEDFFEIFRRLSLSSTTWPYFRELVGSTTSRTNLPTFTLPFRITG